MMIDDVVTAFSEAASRLEFRFEPRFLVTLPDGSSVVSVGWLPHFGSKLGALVFAEQTAPSAATLGVLKEMGYFPSVVYESYGRFDERHFTETLEDWGFFGPAEERPAWYTGNTW